MILAVINQKGGVGKTTSVQNLAAGLKQAGKRVLCVDLDSQCNLTYAMGVNSPSPNLFDVLTGKASAAAAIVNGILPASPQLATADIVLTQIGKEFRLKESLTALLPMYDYILLDCPPSLGILSVNALTCADACLIPVQADVFSLTAVNQLSDTVRAIRAYTNPALAIAGILICRYNGRTVLSRDMVSALENTAEGIGTHVFGTKIRECSALKEAALLRTDIFDYNGKSNGAADYSNLVSELLKEEFIHG